MDEAVKKKSSKPKRPTQEQVEDAMAQIKNVQIGLQALTTQVSGFPGMNPSGLIELSRRLGVAQNYLAGAPSAPPLTKTKPKTDLKKASRRQGSF
tara:strand:- start:17078 stop:17362 length:285 start_codon:yes stop_codon:yes gene_type:complete